MPYGIKQLSDGYFQVINLDNGKIHSKHTTKSNAKKQVRLLYAIDHGFVPRGRK